MNDDDFVAPTPNGPISDSGALRAGHYHLRFNAISGDTFDRCMNDLMRLLLEQGEPFSRKFAIADNLINRTDSPLRPSEKTLLQEALAGSQDAERVAKSLKLLGIK